VSYKPFITGYKSKPETISTDNNATPKRRLSIFNKNENSSSNKSQKSRDNSYSSKFEKNKQTTKCSEKLKNLFSLISGNLISDYSDLLVDFKDESLLLDLKQSQDSNEMDTTESDETSANKAFNLLKSIDCFYDNEELKSINNEKLIQFLINIMVKSCRMYDVATVKTDEKMSYWRYANPIVAAFKSRSKASSSSSSSFSLTSKLKNHKNKKQIVDSSTQTIQPNSKLNDYYEETNTSVGTEQNQNTVIEAKTFEQSNNKCCQEKKLKEENLLTQSIIELISESLSLPIDSNHASNDNNNNNNKTNQNSSLKLFSFNGKKSRKKIENLTKSIKNQKEKIHIINKSHREDIEKIEMKIKKEEEILAECDIKFIQMCDEKKNIEKEEETDQIKDKNSEEEEVEVRGGVQQEEEEDEDYNEDKNKNKLYRETIANSSKSINKKRLTHYGIRSSSKIATTTNNNNNNNDNNNLNRHGHFYHQRRSQRKSIRLQNNNNHNNSKLLINNNNNNNNNSKAQDETLRDAENISDIDDELDIDQWTDINNSTSNNSNLNNNNNNHKKIATGNDLNSNSNKNVKNTKKISNENSKISLSRTGNNKIINSDKQISSTSLSISSTPLSLSLSSSSSSKFNNNNNNNKCDALCMFNSTLNVCHFYRTNDSEPPAKLKSPKHISVQVNLDNNNNNEKNNNEEKKDIDRKNIKKIKKNQQSKEEKVVEEEDKNLIENMENEIWNNNKSSQQVGILKQIERTHSLDSLENDEFDEVSQTSNKHIIIDAQNHSDFNVDLDINISRIDNNNNSNSKSSSIITNNNNKEEISKIPEIKIDFQFKKTNQDLTTTTTISPNNNDNEYLKKRTRESLKFWKEEEEKRKQHESSSSLNNSYSILSTATISSVGAGHDQEKKLKQNSLTTTTTTATATKSPTISIKRVKDRINVFETIKDTAAALNASHKQPIDKIPIDLIASDFNEPPIQSIQSRIRTFEQKSSLQTDSTANNNKIVKESFNNHSFKKISSSRSLDCELDTQSSPTNNNNNNNSSSCIRIPIILTTRVNSNSNYSIKNFSYQVNQQLDKKNRLNHSLGNLISNDLPENEDHQENNNNNNNHHFDYEEEEDDEEEENQEEDQLNPYSDHNDKSATSQTSFLSSNLIVDNNNAQLLNNKEIVYGRDEDDDEDEETSENMEEVEIIIDLKNYNNNSNHQESVHSVKQETKIIDNHDDNDLDLLVDERLKNIVMHMIPTTRKAYVDDIVDGIKQLVNDRESLIKIRSPIDLPKEIVKFIQKRYSSLLNDQIYSKESQISIDESKHSTNNSSNNNNNITTEVTVVKETRKELMLPTQSEKDDDIVKFEEETLYIVEKRRPVPVNILSNTSLTSEVDTEIRKNFELKPKESNQIYIENDHDDDDDDNDNSIIISNNKKFSDYTINNSSLLLIDELKNSIILKNDDISDFQLHFFDLNPSTVTAAAAATEICDRSNRAVLLMLFDKDNTDNYRFSLEKKYHKSIIDTHVTNKKDDINIVAHLNVYFFYNETENNSIDSMKFKTTHFELLSLIRPPTTNEDIASITNKKMFNSLPIGKYFVDIKYQWIVNNDQTEHKNSLIDLSLLPLPIRIQLIYELETSTIDNPTIELMIVDNNLLRNKMIKTKETFIREAFRKHATNIDDSIKSLVLNNILNLGSLRSELSETELANNYQLDKLLKVLEIELNSFYICEQVGANENVEQPVEVTDDSLVKLNRIDALVSFECAQKYKDILVTKIKSNYDDILNSTMKSEISKLDSKIFEARGAMFYLLENGKYYRCLLPISDLIHKTNSDLANNSLNYSNISEHLQHSSVSIHEPHTNIIETYIFGRHLPKIYSINFEEHLIKSVYFKQITLNNDEFQMSIDKLNEDDDNLPSFSESISEPISIKQQQQQQQNNFPILASQDEEKFKKDFILNLTQQNTTDNLNKSIENQIVSTREMIIAENNAETNYLSQFNQANKEFMDYLNQEQEQQQQHFIQCQQGQELTQFETDRLKLDLHLNNIASYNAKQLRDKIIINEIDKMFSAIRDHQGSTIKAKGEEKLCQIYNSSRSGKKKKGCTWSYSSSKRHVRAKIMELPIAEDITQLAKSIGINDLVLNNENQEDTIEKVFVRIDDYLNKEVSKSLQRSYSVDYLNHLASGCRTRIRYIRIPGQQTTNTQNMLNYSYANMNEMPAESMSSTEYRTAPYDLRYWSILKLLEEERNTGPILNYFDDSLVKEQTSIPIEKIMCKFKFRLNNLK